MINSTTDDGAGTTLREAISFAEQSADPTDTVKFDPTVFANGGTILLTQGQIAIAASGTIIIDGRNSAGVLYGITIDAGGGGDGIGNFNGHSVFSITGSAGDVEINGLTLTGGDTPGFGGAIYSGANLTVKNSVITGNASQNGGGGIDSNGNLTVEDSTISGNNTAGMGGGIAFFAPSAGTLNVASSTISGNHGDSGSLPATATSSCPTLT